jgi:hypothetical protein
MDPVMRANPAPLEVTWLREGRPLRIRQAEYEELRVVDRTLVLRDWIGDDTVLVQQPALFRNGPARALVLRQVSRPQHAAAIGEEGSELVMLNLERASWSLLAEIPRSQMKSEGCAIWS